MPYTRCAWETASEQGKRKNRRSLFIYIIFFFSLYSSAQLLVRPGPVVCVNAQYAHTPPYSRRRKTRRDKISKRGSTIYISSLHFAVWIIYTHNMIDDLRVGEITR